MIQANELRLGNWFQSNIYQQVALETLEYLLNPNFAPHSAVKPIPLTPEILEKCGFECVSHGLTTITYVHKGLPEYGRTCYWHAEIGELNLNYIAIGVKYLHQLQNLYFALTGEELEVNLSA